MLHIIFYFLGREMHRKFVSAMEFANKRIFKIEHFDVKKIRNKVQISN